MKEEKQSYVIKLKEEVMDFYADHATMCYTYSPELTQYYVPFVLESYKDDMYKIVQFEDAVDDIKNDILKRIKDNSDTKAIDLLREVVDTLKLDSGVYGDVESIVGKIEKFLAESK